MTRPRNPVARFADSGTIGREVERALDADTGSTGKNVLAVCARVGSAEAPIGYDLVTCERCRHAAWANPELVEVVERRGLRLRVLCRSCAGLAGLI